METGKTEKYGSAVVSRMQSHEANATSYQKRGNRQ